jgi:hypothetical protein
MRQLTQDELDARKEAMRVRAMLRLEANEGYLDKLNAILPAVEADRERLGQDGRRKRIKPLNIAARSFGVKTPKAIGDGS